LRVLIECGRGNETFVRRCWLDFEQVLHRSIESAGENAKVLNAAPIPRFLHHARLQLEQKLKPLFGGEHPLSIFTVRTADGPVFDESGIGAARREIDKSRSIP
jgi:hypothetical protein